MFEPQLPVHALLEEIRELLTSSRSLIIEAPPGAGKTTIVPLALLQEPWLEGRRIVMLQPRRLAAKNAATRMASLLGEVVGETVGYRMRLDSRTSAATRIEVVTEGVLLRMLSEDPSLADVGVLIFDEIHERSLDADLGLSLVLHARETFGEAATPRILAMSATLATAELTRVLQGPCVRSEGRQFPVSVNYGRAAQPRERIVDRCLQTIYRALEAHKQSNLLVFLPGQGEIRQLAAQLQPTPDVSIFPLYGDLSMQEQQRAIAPSPQGQRKVVLATNIAETSLTIDGVDVVVDAGLERVPRFDPNTGMSGLQTVKISQASSEQRRGRAGRLRPGHCYRLWSETQQQQLQPQQVAEIEQADLAPLALQILAWGVYGPDELTWLSAPPSGAYAQAIELLLRLGAVETVAAGHTLTAYGRLMADIPSHPRIAHMLLAGKATGAAETACQIAAVLSERDPVSRESADMRLRLDYLTGELACPAPLRGWRERCRQLASQLMRQLPEDLPALLQRPEREQLPGFLLASAYPDRIARQRHAGGYQLANGRSCQFAEPGTLSRNKWLAVAEVGGLRGRRGEVIRSAAALDPLLFDTVLDALINSTTRVDWDQKSGVFVAERQRRCGALVLDRQRLPDVSDEDRISGLLTIIRSESMRNLPWRGAAQDFHARARLMTALAPDWPSFEDDALLITLEDWLGPFLAPVRKLKQLKDLDLLAALRSRLSWEQQQQLEQWLPERLTVPSGSRVQIDYSQSPPVLAVKLQEMFGCTDSPTLAEGRVTPVVHLLSPAGRPLQVTRDLAGFWASGYKEVKKEMKGRYPKHPWPDNPLEAAPTRHTRHRKH
jgi:ATP-dependent helicase HrpB